MPYKDKEKQKNYLKQHYQDNKLTYQRRFANRRKQRVQWMAELKSKLACERCEESHPACLSFHHRNPKEKHDSVSVMTRDAVVEDKIREEMAKCDVLCENCHRKHHWQEDNDLSSSNDWVNAVEPIDWTKGTYQENKKYYKINTQKRRTQRSKWFAKLKSALNCEKCNESHPSCLSFHHRNSQNKRELVSNMVAFALSEKTIMEEIAKCDVLCENCHRKHHWQAKQNGL